MPNLSVVNLTMNNHNLTMKCLSNMSNFNYKWTKRSNVLPSRAQGVNTSQLTIVNLKPKDSGDYQCVMSNSTGTISSNFSTVIITGNDLISYIKLPIFIAVSLPTISEQPNNITINVHESVWFKCSASGFGVLKIVWKRIEHNMPLTAEVAEEKSLNKITSILKITKAIGYYSGQYYCVGENEVGEVISQTAHLHVQGNTNPLAASLAKGTSGPSNTNKGGLAPYIVIYIYTL